MAFTKIQNIDGGNPQNPGPGNTHIGESGIAFDTDEKKLKVFDGAGLYSMTMPIDGTPGYIQSLTQAQILALAPTAGRIVQMSDGPRGLWMGNGDEWVSVSGQVLNVMDFGAVGEEVYLADVFASEAGFEAAYPRAHAVWENWLKRISRTKPGGVNDPNQADVLSWENLTLDGVAIQEALEIGGVILIPHATYSISDTLWQRQDESTVFCYGTLQSTRGGSRGNLLAIGEGEDLTWIGGILDGNDVATGDNALTVFQNQVTSAVAGFETTNATRTRVSGVRARNFTRDATYGGGKGFSLQHGHRQTVVSDYIVEDCDIGWSIEGKLSSTPISGPTPNEPYYGRAIALSNIVVRRAPLMGAYIHNSSNSEDPSANSVIGRSLFFEDCALDNSNQGVIALDRSTSFDLECMITVTGTEKVIPVRGNPLGGRIHVELNVHDVYHLIDTRHPLSHGNNTVGFDGATIEVGGKIRSNTSTFLIRRATGSGGEAPAPINGTFDICVRGFAGTAVASTTLAASNFVHFRDTTREFSGYGPTEALVSTGRVFSGLTGNLFNVLDYGAVRDGVTNDRTAIQAAITAASAAGGGIVYFPAGTYLVSSRIELKDAVCLVGAGRDVTTIKGASGVSAAIITGLSADTVTDVMLADFSINGNSAALSGEVDGIQITSGSFITCQNLRIFDVRADGISLDATPDASVLDCVIENTGNGGTNLHGVHGSNGSHRLLVRGCTISDNEGMGIRVGAQGTGSTDATIIGNRISKSNAGLECIGVTADSIRARVIGNTCLNGGDNGISMSAADSVVSGNTVLGCNLHGIQVNGARVSVTGNISKNNNQTGAATRAGIHINSVNYVTITGNTCYDDQGTPTQDFGVKLNGVETGSVIVGNQLAGNKTAAISGLVGGGHTVGDNGGHVKDLFNVAEDFGATGDGATDDRASIQAALTAAATAGGGTVYFPKGRYLLSTSGGTAGGMTWQLAVAGDNITLEFEPGAVLVSSVASARVLVAIGGSKVAGQASWNTNENRDATRYNLTGTQTKGRNSVALATVGEAANFAAGDYIYIFTGQLLASGTDGEPDSEINQVKSVDAGTGIVTLRWPLTKTYAAENYNSGSSGKSSVGGGGNAAPYAVAKVTDRTLVNFTLINPQIEASSTVLQAISVWQCVGFKWYGGHIIYPKNGHGSRDVRFAEVSGVRMERRSDGTSGYALAPSTGCTNWNIHHNEIVADLDTYLHIHEGIAASTVTHNRIQCASADSATVPLSIAARAHDLNVTDNEISANCASEIIGILVDADSSGGGELARNRVVAGNAAANIRLDCTGWLGTETNQVTNGRISLRGPLVGQGHRTSTQVLSGWVFFGTQNPTLGTLPRNAVVLNVRCYVRTAFNSDGTDEITVGHDAAADAYATAIDVSTTGVKTPTLGATALIPEESAAITVEAYYTNGGTEPTTGEAFIVVEYALGARRD